MHRVVLGRWNKLIAKSGVQFEFKMPHEGFHRQIGVFSSVAVDPDGAIVSAEEWAKRQTNGYRQKKTVPSSSP